MTHHTTDTPTAAALAARGGVAAVTAGVRRGDREALEALYESCFPALLADARRISRRDEAFALDMVHDVMLRVVRSIPTLYEPRELDAWLRRALVSATIDRIRSERRRTQREAMHVLGRAATDTPATTTQDDRAWLEQRLSGLTDDERAMLVQREGLGHSLRAVAEQWGLTPAAVHGRVRRLLADLRRSNESRSLA